MTVAQALEETVRFVALAQRMTECEEVARGGGLILVLTLDDLVLVMLREWQRESRLDEELLQFGADAMHYIDALQSTGEPGLID